MAIGVGIDSFAYHRFFGECTKWETPLDIRWTTDDFLKRAAELGVKHVSLQTAYLGDLTSTSIAALRARLAALDLIPTLAWGHPDGLQGGENAERFAALRATLPLAKDLGCRTVRLVCGNHFSFRVPAAERRSRLLPLLKEAVAAAAALDLTLAVENHADFAMADLVGMVREVGDPRLGICFDTGNSVRVGDDLLVAGRLAAPLVKMVHLKDMRVIPESRGDPTRWWPTVPLGRGDFDLAGFVGVLRSAGFEGTLFIELANMHPDFADEDAAVAEGIAWLRNLLV